MTRTTSPKASVVARLTVVRKNGQRTIVEIQADASFHFFYHFYKQDGLKRSTKTLIRTANRNEGLPVINSLQYEPGLEMVLARLSAFQNTINPIVKHTLRIIKKRAYRSLIMARPDAIGILKVQPVWTVPQPTRITDRIPSTFTTTARKWSILSSRRVAQEVS